MSMRNLCYELKGGSFGRGGMLNGPSLSLSARPSLFVVFLGEPQSLHDHTIKINFTLCQDRLSIESCKIWMCPISVYEIPSYSMLLQKADGNCLA
eukprot:scaffold12040_cov144-Skeletonema_dohrnii-CCMP3373.AAC.6